MESRRPTYRPPTPPRATRLPQIVYWRRRAIVLLSLITICVLGYLGITLAFALNNQSYGASYSARAAEWGRDHGLSGLVTWVEAEYYRLNPPKKGGAPSLSAFGSGPTAVKIPKGGHLPAPTT